MKPARALARLRLNYGNGAPTRSCTRLACLPSRCIADNALGASKMVGARRLARPRLPDSESGGSAIPREPRADEIGVPDRLRSGDLLHERQACWLDYTTGTKDGEGKRICTFDLMHVTHPLWLAELCPRKWWERRVLPSLPLACQTSALLMSYVPENVAGERSRTVVSALARPHSAVEPHPLEMVSPAGISPATWSLGHSRSVL